MRIFWLLRNQKGAVLALARMHLIIGESDG
jgi:hypothetical protein